MMLQIVMGTDTQSKRHHKIQDKLILIIINVKAKRMQHQLPRVVEKHFKNALISVTQQMPKGLE